MNFFLEAALKYHQHGLSVVPTDALKQSLVRWKDFQSRKPSETELKQMFNNLAVLGVGIITGKASSNLEAIDIDTKYDQNGNLMKELFGRIREQIPSCANKLIISETRSKGFHLIYRTDNIGRNIALAKRPSTDAEKLKNPKEKCKVLIETRGEGGYIIVPPTSGYKILQGSFANIPCISTQEREILFTISRSFNTFIQPQLTRTPSKIRPTGEVSPFDDYNQRGDLTALLEKHGWTTVSVNNRRTNYRRPGDTDKLISGNYNHDLGLFSVFSTSTEFETNRGYRPYAVFAVLECNGDFQQAVKKLAAQGFGNKNRADSLTHSVIQLRHYCL